MPAERSRFTSNHNKTKVYSSCDTLDKFERFYRANVQIFENRLRSFKRSWQKRILQELIFCLCTPQTSPLKADLASIRINEELQKKPLTVDEIAAILRDPKNYVRFHRTKALRIQQLILSFDDVYAELTKNLTPHEERAFLVRHVKGFSFKEASHALRNLGREGLAIIDRHIIRFLSELRLVHSSDIKNIQRHYNLIEAKIRELCNCCRFNMDAFDIAVFMFKTGFFLK